MTYNEATKNDTNHESKTRMYAVVRKESCPVKFLKLYLSKRNPESDLLYQQARNRVLSLMMCGTPPVLLVSTLLQRYDEGDFKRG